MKLTHRFKILGLSMAVVTLAACGGGDDDPLPTDASTDAVAKYVGSWKSDCYSDSGASAHLRADFTKAAADTLGGSVIVYYYVGTSCSGPSVKDDKVLEQCVAQGGRYQGCRRRDRRQIPGWIRSGHQKVVLYTDGSTLQIGDPDGAEDAEGYANTFFEYAMKRL